MNTFIKKFYLPLMALGLLLLAYVPTLDWMWDRWWARDSYYSHGILVPFVSLFLLWSTKDQLKNIELKESPWGLPLIIAGIGLHLFSTLFRINFTSGFALLFVFIGLCLYFFGTALCRKIAFPLIFLIFMLPLPEVMITNMSFELKMMAAKLATSALNHMRIPAIQEGSLIQMRHAHVVVDDVCSGLRSLITLTALGSIFAYYLKGGAIKKTILFLSTIPIAVITNMARVIVLAVIAEIWGPELLEGFVHDATGFLVFIIAFILLGAIQALLETDTNA